MQKALKFILLLCIILQPIYGKGKTVSGYVINAFNKQKLSYANIQIVDTKIGTTTDEMGYFKLDIPGKNNQIVISYIGFKSEIIATDSISVKNDLVVELYPKGILLHEVPIYSSTQSRSEKIDASSLSLKNEQIEKISNAMPDVLRSFQALPGISANNEFSAEFNVRGGNKDENLIQVNGAQVYEPFHLKEAPNASVGVFNVDLIQNVNITTGGFSARYGDRLSSVANIDYREGNISNYKGAATISLAFMDGYIEGPLFNNASFIIGARKTYMEYVLDVTDFGYKNMRRAEPTFYDLQGMISLPYGKSDKLKLSFLQSGDDFKYDPENMEYTNNYSEVVNNKNSDVKTLTSSFEKKLGDYYSSLFDLMSINFLSNNAFITSNISYYDQGDKEFSTWGNYFRKDIDGNDNLFEERNREDVTEISLRIKTFELKTALDYQVTPFYELKTGVGYKDILYFDHFDYTKNSIISTNIFSFPDTVVSDYGYVGLDYRNSELKAKSFKYNGYMENLFQIGENLIVNLAGRIDYFDINKQTTISPRINLAYSTASGTIFRAAWGHYYQSPIYTQLKYSEPSDTNTKAQKAIHYVVGVEKKYSLSSKNTNFLKFKIDAYYKDYENLISSFFAHSDRLAYSRENDAVGYAQGIDVYVLYSMPGFYTWVSYSYLEAMENNLNDDEGYYPRLTSQKHTISWIADFTLGKNWSLSTKFYYGSGYPYAEKFKVYDEESDSYFWVKSDVNGKKLPEYQRLDLRISKNFDFGTYKLKTFFELSNSLNHKNIRGYDYTYDKNGNPVAYEIELWPLLPSFGIRVQF